MFHCLEPFDFERLCIRIEAHIDTKFEAIRTMQVFKVGELGHKDIDITDALLKDEREALEELVLEDYRECEAKSDDPDPLLLSKQNKEWEAS